MRTRILLLLMLGSLPLKAQPLGYLSQDLRAKEAYRGQSAYMDFYHDLALSQEDVDISLSGLLSIDGYISSGPVYEKDLARLYPFPNTLVVLWMSGEEIRRYLEASYAAWAGPEGLLLKNRQQADGSIRWNFLNSPSNFDSAGGISYTVDLSKSVGERVRISTLADGTSFHADSLYKVGITSYRAAGAGHLLEAAGIDPKDMENRIVRRGAAFRDILRTRLASADTLRPGQFRHGHWSFAPQAALDSLDEDLKRIFGLPATGWHSTHAEVMSQIERAGGVYLMYPTDQPRPTAAPKGYEPFYISHLGRHGARYALGETVYTDLWDIWSRGHEKGWLTPEGETIYEAYKELYPSVAHREGQLSRKGQEQHRLIARQMFRNYPHVFKGKTRGQAVSTNAHRVIASMYSFLEEVHRLDKDFSCEADYGFPVQAILLPGPVGDPSWPAAVQRKYDKFMDDRLDVAGKLAIWFIQPDSLVKHPYRFLNDMHAVISDLDNLDGPVPTRLYNIFTPEERYRLWEVYNYNGYLRFGLCPDTSPVWAESMKPLFRDIMERAETDWREGIRLRLRFGHDLSLMPLLSLMDVNGMGAKVKDPYDVADYWRIFDVPMACNLQLVFFQSKKNPEILVQVLLNGFEATLPLEMAAPGSFYRWEDIKHIVQNP